MTGHCLGAAGVIEALACILAVTKDIVPPTINHFTDDPELDPKLNFTFNKAQHRTVNAALSNTFGFGGHNASVIVKKYKLLFYKRVLFLISLGWFIDSLSLNLICNITRQPGVSELYNLPQGLTVFANRETIMAD